MLEDTVQNIIRGIDINGIQAYARKVTTGRFKEGVNLEIYLREDFEEEFVLFAEVYYGRLPHYRPWVEFFGIHSPITLKTTIDYFDSIIEEDLLEFFSKPLGPGGKIYVECLDDRETSYGLQYDIPPPVTRLGYKLFRLGFTWFKDWYFPEGGSEGGQKLQGEKPLDEEARKRHLEDIGNEIFSFMERAEVKKIEVYEEYQGYLLRAKERAEKILSTIIPPLDQLRRSHL